MSDLAWLLGLLIILMVTLFVMFTLPLMMTVYGETREECVQLNSTKLILIVDKPNSAMFKGDCDWIITEVLEQGNYDFRDFEYQSGVTQWVFTK